MDEGLCHCCKKRPRLAHRTICARCERSLDQTARRRRAARATPIPLKARCVHCGIRYRQLGKYCVKCSGDTRGQKEREADAVEAKQVPGIGRNYHPGAFCPVRAVAPETRTVRDPLTGQTITYEVAWDGRKGLLNPADHHVPDAAPES